LRDEDEDNDEDDEDDEQKGLKWKSRTKFASLQEEERARLPSALKKVLEENSFRWIGSKPGFYKFVHLVTKRFRSVMNRFFTS